MSMPLIPARCKNCGAFISADDSHKYIVCPYCRKKYTAEEAIRNFYEKDNESENHKDDDEYSDFTASDFVVVGGVLEKYTGESTIIAVPGNVREISTKAFRELSQITLVTLPEGLRTIQESAFKDCISLTSIYIPLSVRKIGACAFEGCTSLTAVNISDNIKDIGNAAFRNCTSLSLIHVINGVQCISNSMFEGCTALKEIRLADGVRHIGSSAFRNCTSLTRIYNPDTVTNIGDHAFCGCTAMGSVYLPEGIENIEAGAFMNCTRLRKAILGEGVRNIGDSVFESCRSLVSMVLPESVYSVGRGIFNKCSSLAEIAYSSELLPTLDRDTGWSGITCNPFEGSLMSEHYESLGACPRCGGTFVFVSKEDTKQTDDPSANEGFFKKAISRSSLLQKYIQQKPKQNPVGYYDCSYFKCLSCKYKKLYRPTDSDR